MVDMVNISEESNYTRVTGHRNVPLSYEDNILLQSLALVSLAVSLLSSTVTVRFWSRKKPAVRWRRRKLAERLVMYMAITDLMFSVEHIVDHGYLLVYHHFPTPPVCAVMGFLLQEFAVAQGILVLYTATNAFSLIVRSKRIKTGRYDWRLLVVSFGLPAVSGSVFAALGVLGPAETWCLVDKEIWWTSYIDLFYALYLLTVLISAVLSYSLVYYQITAIKKNLSRHLTHQQLENKKACLRSAAIMGLFIVAYILQWNTYMLYSVWSLFATPTTTVLALTVCFVNMGGLFNFLAYTVLRGISSSASHREDSHSRHSNLHSPSQNGAVNTIA